MESAEPKRRLSRIYWRTSNELARSPGGDLLSSGCCDLHGWPDGDAMKIYRMDIPFGIDGTDVILDVEYTYTPRRPAVMYLRNGDPGYPEEPQEIEVQDIRVGKELVPEWFDQAICNGDYLIDWIDQHHDRWERDE